MLTGATTDYLEPDAPVDYGVGRVCEKGASCKTLAQTGQVGKLNRYAGRMGSNGKGPKGPLLCSLCQRDWQDDQVTKEIERQRKKNQRIQTLPLPNLKVTRKRAGISQKTLAKMVGVTDSYISEIESKGNGANYATAHNIARSLNVSLDYLRGKK